jgi:hypothetical protein
MNILRKIPTFLKSLAFHVWSGFPKSSQEEINYRFQICQGCDLFDNRASQCLVCGCNINSKKIFINKLAWADQECPKGKWKKINRNSK